MHSGIKGKEKLKETEEWKLLVKRSLKQQEMKKEIYPRRQHWAKPNLPQERQCLINVSLIRLVAQTLVLVMMMIIIFMISLYSLIELQSLFIKALKKFRMMKMPMMIKAKQVMLKRLCNLREGSRVQIIIRVPDLSQQNLKRSCFKKIMLFQKQGCMIQARQIKEKECDYLFIILS